MSTHIPDPSLDGRDPTAPTAANLRAEMHRLGVTNNALAKALDVDPRQITRWRQGQEPRGEALRRWADYFDRTPGWFHDPHDEPVAA